MEFMNNKKILLSCLSLIFLGIHLIGIYIPYHQDEYKWVYYASPETPAGAVPHPPLTEFIYKKLGPVVGDNNFRLIPTFFGLVNLLLIFVLIRKIFDTRTALWSTFLFTISFYSVLASLTVDVDGAIMPFFFLLMMIGYYELRTNNYEFGNINWKWLVLLIIGAVGGVLIKMSGVLPIGAILIDFAINKKFLSEKKKILKFFGISLFTAVLVISVLLLAKLIFPFFPIEKSITYWKHFANSSSFFDRGWLQTFIQFAKAIMYTSPLLILPAFLVDKEIFKKTRPFFIFIFIGLVFYLFAFDFSIGALDRYFQFLVIPLCVISGAVLARLQITDFRLQKVIIPIIFSVVIFATQFLIHFVPPLYPKTEWLNRLVSIEWNFLFPFTGGSGPTGFYVSFMFIALTWLISLIFIRRKMLLAVLILGLLYNFVFIEEYLLGKINGSVTDLFREAKTVIIKDPNIKSVLVYNDIGGFEIQQTGKYKRRIYAAPQFEATYKEIFDDFNGYILFIDIPRISADSFYGKYFEKCKSIYMKSNRYINSSILDCTDV